MGAFPWIGTRLDRHIARRFLQDFIILFLMLFAFATLIDAVLRLEEFRAAAAALMGGEAHARWWHVLATIGSFHGPRVFQFYQYLFGLVAVAAAGFTVARMQKDRELIAMLSAGISLPRVAAPILVGTALLCGLQVVNQEVILPVLSPHLASDLKEIGGRNTKWAIPLEVDARGNLFRAASFDPSAGVLERVVIYRRGPDGQLKQRISAPRARWSQAEQAWILEGGVADARGAAAPGTARETTTAVPLASIPSDLGPTALSLRQSALAAHLIPTMTLRQMRSAGSIGPVAYRHLVGSRIAVLVVNLALLAISLPFLLRREPVGLLKPAIESAAVMVPLGILSLGALAVPNPWLGPAVGLMLPVAVLVPLAAWRLAAMKT
ncbi:MAG: LptF/LptG family permease [Planctomycetota bacterium]|nr:LptF/LptG family permease [Planctomycetota bacterium]MDA1105771.1 LptF/LptG family permease [Planctomycetota bacterium]